MTVGGPLTALRVARVGALAVATLTCANVEAPPGTAPDFEPPGVAERYPAPGSIVPDLDGDAWIRFDEPVQSPRNLERGLDLSPAWEWRFNPRVSGFSVRPREGWRPGVVYRIRIPAGVSDLIRNRTAQAIEWTFSTGPEISDTRVDGIVYDRVTVAGVRDARVLFLPADSVPYSVVSDTGGVYGMRALPPGDYSVFAFQDQNRNLRLDADREPWDSARVSLPLPESRYALDLWMVPPDSTPPVLLAAVPFDTITLVLEFDEPLDPEASLDGAVVTVRTQDGGRTIAVTGLTVGQASAVQGVGAAETESDTAEVGEAEVVGDTVALPDTVAVSDTAALRDSATVRDTAAAPDSVAVPGPPAERDTSAVDRRGRPPTGPLQSAELRDLPYPSLVVRLEQALSEDTFRVSASGIPNLRGLTGGGDTTFVYVAPPPAEAPVMEIDPRAEPEADSEADPGAGRPAEDRPPPGRGDEPR